MRGSVPLSDANVPGKFGNIENLVRGIVENKVKLSDLKTMKPFFKLSPSKGGFKRKSKKQYTDGGILGSNKNIPELYGGCCDIVMHNYRYNYESDYITITRRKGL